MLARTLRAAGLSVTRTRMEVLALLRDSAAPISHAEAAELLSKNPQGASIYRNLQCLVDAGLARRVDLGDRIWRYEQVPALRAPNRTILRLLCSGCGKVWVLPANTFRPKTSAELPRAVFEGDFEMQIRSTCDACRR